MSRPDDLWGRLAALTPARIGLGRAGNGLSTREVLRFGLAHAEARDAVHAPMDAAAVAAASSAPGQVATLILPADVCWLEAPGPVAPHAPEPAAQVSSGTVGEIEMSSSICSTWHSNIDLNSCFLVR